MTIFSRSLGAVLGLLLLGIASGASATARSYTLYITAGNLTVNGTGGATLSAWGYSDVSGAPRVPGPVLTAYEGDAVTITVINNHTISHNFVIKGVTTDATAIAPGDSRVYKFTAASAGTYAYSDTLNSSINREMGMFGALWIGPSDGSNKAWTNGPAYSFQRVWVITDMDKKRWNDIAGSGGNVTTTVYKPNYFLINGKGGSDAMTDPNTTIDGLVGTSCLVRIINTGQFSESLHFHANHAQVLTLNGVRQSTPYVAIDVINIPPMGTADLLYVLNQPGTYPMHVHSAQMETANGTYLNGAVTMIKMH